MAKTVTVASGDGDVCCDLQLALITEICNEFEMRIIDPCIFAVSHFAAISCYKIATSTTA